MTPLERAARAIAASRIQFGTADAVGRAMEDLAWQDHVGDVRAVLAAIREPGEAALDAGYAESGAALQAWQAMIDAIAEGK